MMTSALLIAMVLNASADTRGPQLWVVDRAKETVCREAPSTWDPAVTSEEAPASAVAEDLNNYFGGLSVQFTHFLEAAWHGHVRFCTDEDENDVLRVLVKLVVRPPTVIFAPPELDSLPGGAAEILKPLASGALIRHLLEIQPANEAERNRRQAALAVVRSAIPAAQP
jgi:hypothetical protein